MENAADALKMAGWVLIFVVALSICINAFTQARGAMDTIMTYSDRQTLTDWIDGSDEGTTRTVKGETIIPTLYRVFKEDFTARFEFRSGPSERYLFKSKGKEFTFLDSAIFQESYGISLSNELIKIPDGKQLDNFPNGISYRDYFMLKVLYGDIILNGTAGTDVDNKFKRQYSSNNFEFITNGLNGILKNSQFTETLGVYYPEELNNSDAVPDAIKKEKRIITYTEN